MYGDDYDDDYYYEQRRRREIEAKEAKRKNIRTEELSADETKKRGWELLKKIVDVLPKKMTDHDKYARKPNFTLTKDGLTVVIKLKPHPTQVTDFVVRAFEMKGFKANHKFKDTGEVFDRLVLTFPEDWHLRLLLLGPYDPKKTDTD